VIVLERIRKKLQLLGL